MIEVINQSGACIFLQVDLEGIVARGMKSISMRVFSTLTSLVIHLLIFLNVKKAKDLKI